MDRQGYSYRGGGGGGYNRNGGFYQQQQHNGAYYGAPSGGRNQAPRYNQVPTGPPRHQMQTGGYPAYASYHQPQQQPPQHQPAPYSVPYTTLSPNAEEFIPSSFMIPRDPQFGGGGHHMGGHHSGGRNHLDEPYSSGGLGSSYDDDDDALLQLQTFITDVTLSPALFESRVYEVADVIFDDLKKNPQNTQQIVATIFQAGVLQQNFRYSGARLCDYLSDLVAVQGRHVFREHLLDHAFKTVSAAKAVVGDKDRDKEARGIALFCAELLSQMDLGYSIPIVDRYPEMGPALSRIIKQLIISNDKDNRKNSIQALKLCGGNLEKLCQGTDAMDTLLAECKTIEDSEGLDATIKLMLARLPELRKTNWGYVQRVKSDMSGYGQAQVDYNQMPVMYGPDGLPISPEEMGFLDGNGAMGGEFSDSSQGGAGMDDEALEAYEQFLQETGQK